MPTKEQITNLTGILATASVTGIGFALGGTTGAAIIGGIGINLWSNVIQNGAINLKERWLLSNDGLLNHDIQQALVRAFIKALTNLETKYFALDETNALTKEKKEAIKSLFRELKDQSQTVFLSSIERATNEQEVKEYLYGDPQEAENKLWQRIEGTKLIYTYYGEHFKNFLRDNCLNELVLCFGEELKTDNKECNKAWRAFQRMLLEGIQADVKAVQASQDAIHRDLQVLNELRAQIDRLQDTVDCRLPNEPFQQGLEQALRDMHAVLHDVAQTTQRTEAKIDTIVSVLGAKPEAEIPKVPEDIQALFDEGWDLLELGKYDDAKAIFQKALELAAERNHAYAVAEAKYNQAVVLIEFQRNPSAAKPLLQECLEEYRNANSDLDVAAVLRQFGLIEISNGNFDQAKAYTSQALEIYKSKGKKTGIGDSLRQLGWIAHALGNLSQAIDLYDQSLACSLELYQTRDSKRQKGEAQAIAACYAHKGMVFQAQGNIAEAELSLTQALEWQRKSGFKSETAKALLLLAELKCREGKFEAGIEHLNEAGNLYKEIGDNSWLARCLDLLARLHFTGGKVEKATALFEGALEAVEKSGDVKEQELYLNKLGQLYLKDSKVEQARKYFERARDLSLRENMLDGYAAAVERLAKIAEIENKKDEQDALLTDGIQALEKLLVSTQREPERASIIGQIGSFYAKMGNFQQALAHFQREKKAYESLSNLGGIANALAGIAWMQRELGRANEEFDTYREIKKLVDGSPYYDLIAGAANNLASCEIRHGNLVEAKRLLEEAEFYCRKYNLPSLFEVEMNQEILASEFKKIKPPELNLEELITDLFDLMNSFPESRDSLFRLWFFEKAADLHSNYRSMFGVKLMICQDDVDTFLKTAGFFAPYSELFLQAVSDRFPGTINEQFIYPTERGFHPIFSIAAVPKGTPKDAKLKLNFSKVTRRYIAFLGSNLISKSTGSKGCLVIGWSIGLPEQAHQLILSSSAADLIRQKVFFLPYERYLANDELLSVLRYSKELRVIPVYFDSLPESEEIKLLAVATISLPILSTEIVEQQRKQIRKVKRALMQLLSITEDSAQSALNDFVFEVGELADNCESCQSIQIQVNVLQFPSRLEKEMHIAMVINEQG